MIADLLIGLLGALVGTLAGFLISRHYAKQAEASLDEQVRRLSRIVGDLANVVADPDSTRLRVDDENMPVRGIVRAVSLSGVAVASSSAQATLTVTPLFDRSKFDALSAEWDARWEAVQAKLEAQGPDWQQIMFP